MKNIMFTKYSILYTYTLLDALKTINEMGKDEVLTLFVEDEQKAVIGTLTDGDIRRSLVKGGTLETKIGDIAHHNFSYLKAESYDVRQIHTAKKQGIELLPILNDQMQIVDVLNLKKQQSYLPVDAVLMAGGKGERLRPLTEKTPKPLLPVGDKAIIDHNIDRLLSYGVEHISVTVNYLHKQIEEHFSQPRDQVQIHCIREPKYLGTIGSVKFVDIFYNDTILVMNSDLFTSINYEDFYLHFKEHGADMAVAAVPYSVSVPYGIFELDGRDVQGVLEKPTYNYYANAGVYLIKRDLLRMIPNDTFYNATDFMQKLIHEKMKVVRFPITGYWIDIGKHEDYKRAQDLVNHL